MQLRTGPNVKPISFRADRACRRQIGGRQWPDRRPNGLRYRSFGPFRAHSSRARHQFAPRHPQVAQREQRLHLGRVFLQPAVAHLGESKLALDHPERVLHLRPNARQDLLRLVDHRGQRAAQVQRLAPARTHGNMPSHLGFGVGSLAGTLVTGIAKGIGFLPVQQAVGLDHVVDVARRAAHRMHQARFGVHADVGLHAEVVSRPQELPPQPLAEPYVKLSLHTAPVIQPAGRPRASDGTAAVQPFASCPAIRGLPPFGDEGPCTFVWPNAQAHDRCAGRCRAWRSCRTHHSIATTVSVAPRPSCSAAWP
jgi:hypothetical protein